MSVRIYKCRYAFINVGADLQIPRVGTYKCRCGFINPILTRMAPHSSKLLKTVSGVSNIYGTTYGLKYINIYIYIYIENPRIEQTRKLASLAIMLYIHTRQMQSIGRAKRT